jgi:hypothetical protein
MKYTKEQILKVAETTRDNTTDKEFWSLVIEEIKKKCNG